MVNRGLSHRLLIVLGMGVGVVPVASAFAQKTPQHSAPRKDGKVIPFESEELARLDMLTGPWNLTETHYDRRGKEVGTADGTEEITWILDQRAIRRVYTRSGGSSAYHAIGTLTWNEADKKYRGVWFDNASKTLPVQVTGEWSPDNRSWILTLEAKGADGLPIRYKVVEEMLDDERRVATTYELKGTQVIKRMKVEYKRAVPCPARLRPIFDDLLGR